MTPIQSIVCRCSEIILKSESSVAKIRSKIMIMRDDGVYAVCKSCNAEVAVPLVRVIPDVGPPLILRK